LKFVFRFSNLQRTGFHTRALAKIGGKTRRTSVAGLNGLSKLLNARVRFSHPGVRPFGLWGGANSGFFCVAFHESEYQRLRAELQAAQEASQLPELPSEETRAALNDLRLRVRLRPTVS